jgi:hypothetical protein
MRVHLMSTRAHARSQDSRWKPARSNTSVDALNTAIILCLVGEQLAVEEAGMVGGQPFAVNRPRRRDHDGHSLVADLRCRGTLTYRCIIYWVYRSNVTTIIRVLKISRLATQSVSRVLGKNEREREKERNYKNKNFPASFPSDLEDERANV